MPASRKRKRKKRSGPASQKTLPIKVQSEPWDIVAQLESLILIRTAALATAIGFLGLLLLALFYIPAMTSPAINRLPHAAKVGYAYFGSTFMIANFILARRGQKFHLRTRQDRKRARKVLRWMVALSIVSLGVAILPTLFVSGFADKALQLVNRVFPNVNAQVRDAASYLITIMVSGVIGNLVYDVLKTLFVKSAQNRIRRENAVVGKLELFK